MTPALMERFLGAFPAAEQEQLSAEPELPELGDVLAVFCAAAQTAHPEFLLPLEEFLPYAAERLLRAPGPRSWVRALSELPAADLYLACGCLRSVGAALAAFKTLCMAEAQWALKRLRLPMAVEDLHQLVLVRLLTAERNQPPRLAQYAGRSSLSAWVRVVATREALMVRRKEQPPQKGSDLCEALSVSTRDPELAFFKDRYREELRASFRWALQELDVRQRNLLRHQLLFGRTIDDLAALYRVNRTTASRWLEKTRHTLFTLTRRHMMKRLRVPQDEFHSILRLLHSQIDERLICTLSPALEVEATSPSSP